MLTTFFPPYSFGGDAYFVEQLSHALVEEGHEVEVIHCLDSYRCLSRAPLPVPRPSPAGLTVHRLQSRWGRLSPLFTQQTGQPGFKRAAIQQVLDSKPFDVLHFHNISLLGGPGLLSMGKGLKLYTTHEYWLLCPTHVLFREGREACREARCFQCQLSYRRPPQWWRYSFLLQKSLKHLDAILCPSRFTLEQHRRLGQDLPLYLAPNFVAEEVPLETEPPLPDRPYFLYVGRLEKIKGLQTILPIFREEVELEIRIAGQGNYEASLQRMCQGSANIHFLGRLPRASLQSLYRGALATLIPSINYEVCPLVAQEAQSQGCPVIVPDLGALPETVEGGGGLVYHDAQSLRTALWRLRKHADLRARLSEAARSTWQRQWTRRAHLDRYFAVIEKL